MAANSRVRLISGHYWPCTQGDDERTMPQDCLKCRGMWAQDAWVQDKMREEQPR